MRINVSIKFTHISNINIVGKVIPNIHISVLGEDKEILQMETAKAKKGKFSFLSKHNSYYYVCVEKTNLYWGDRDPLFVKLKIMSDNMDEPDLKKAIKNEDLDPVKDKFSRLIKRGEKLVKYQENDLSIEDEFATRQMEYASFYYYIAIFQFMVVIILAVYQFFSFKNLFNSVMF